MSQVVFLSLHPGGAAIILKQAGTVRTRLSNRFGQTLTVADTDEFHKATTEFKKYHSLELHQLSPGRQSQRPHRPQHPRRINKPGGKITTAAASALETDAEKQVPHVTLCVSYSDLVKAAEAVLLRKSLIYISISAHYKL
jgi:L-lactate dehydrogenase (cytochrome)